jgi:hypothetical protein
MATPYAHSLPGEPISAWEPLAAHAEAVGSAASNFAARIGWSDAGKAVGLLHDAGKCSTEFQAYLRATDTGRTRRVDHSTYKVFDMRLTQNTCSHSGVSPSRREDECTLRISWPD